VPERAPATHNAGMANGIAATAARALRVVAAYVRVSSYSQDASMQRDAIARACSARGEGEPEWYSDTWTGGALRRPSLDSLRQAVREGRIGKLYVWRLDRLTRSGIRDTLDLVEELTRHGCELVTIADGFTLEGPGAEIVLAVLAWAAKMERLAIGERISAARERAKAEGKGWGRPKRLNRVAVKQIRALRETGSTVRAIAASLKVPRSTVWRALSQKPTKFRPPKKTGKMPR
jgi:DNA invertase Pin-like site-specific DNA recombinase